MKKLTIKFPGIFFLFISIITRAQTSAGTITGTVSDETTGKTMPGVNVVIEGTLRGASTR